MTYYNKFRRQYSFQLKANNKVVTIINLYRIPDRTSKGLYMVKAQLDMNKN